MQLLYTKLAALVSFFVVNSQHQNFIRKFYTAIATTFTPVSGMSTPQM